MARQPCHHVISAVVGQSDRAQGEGIRLDGRHAKGGADVGQGVITLGVKFHQARGEVVAARFKIDATRQPEIADGIGRTRVGVARLGDGRDGCAELGLGRLLAESVAPLE